MSIGGGLKRAAILAAALALLNVSLTFTNVWPTPIIRLNTELSAELGAFVLFLALARGRGWVPSRKVLRVAGIVWMLLVVARYADVTVQSLFGREVNLYWESQHFSAVGAMLATVTNPWLVAGIVGAVIVIPIALYRPLRWAIAEVSAAAGEPSICRALVVMGVVTVLLGAVQIPRGPEEQFIELPKFQTLVTPIYARQVKTLAVELSGVGRKPIPPATPITSDFSRIKGADVFVLFLEAYGETAWRRPEYVQGLIPARQRFEAAIAGSGRDVVSAYVESPTFGGSSWLAHVSLLSGVEVRDGDTNMRMMAQGGRETFVTAFKRHGYETIAMMPGLRMAWPEGKFYGFDRIVDWKGLEYVGPPFGWWDVTDQYVLAKMDQLAVAPQPRKPIFVFFPTISTHAPFLPAPPYQPDWSRMLKPGPYDQAERDAAWDEGPNWLNLGPGYVKALTYSFDTIGGYLQLRKDRDFVVILIGDHQPAAVVTGDGASWNVPAHIIASRPELLDALKAHGFTPGLEPRLPVLGRIDQLTALLVDAFGGQPHD